jgi:hypothetical protein
MPNYYGPRIVTDNLVTYLDAASSKSYSGSGSTWTDISRSNNNALINAPTFSSENLGGFIFDGTDDYASISSFTNTFNGPFSLSVTFYQTSNTVSQALFSNYNGGSNDGLFMQINSAGEGSGLRITYRQLGADVFNFTQTAAVSLNRFYNIVCTYNGANAYTYYNAVRQSVSAAATTYFSPANTTLFIGTLTGADRLFTGRFYDIKIYKKSLSETEVAQNYNTLKGRFKL